MQISPISQRNDRTQFGACLIYDNKGYLTRLVQRKCPNITDSTIELAKRFKRIGTGQKLEILDWQDVPYSKHAQDPNILYNTMRILNRSNGKVLDLELKATSLLKNLLEKLVENEDFYKCQTPIDSLVARIVEQ